MPKSKGKGGKTRRRGKGESIEVKRELVYKDDEGQDYAQVLRMLGNGRLEAYCYGDGQKRIAHIRGKMQKKVWMGVGDVILVSLRDYQDDKADVIYKYNSDEARLLKNKGELPESAKINEGEPGLNEGEDNDAAVEFGEDSEGDGEGAEGQQRRIAPQRVIKDLSSDEEESDLDIDDI